MKSISLKDGMKKFLGYSIELPLFSGRLRWLNKRFACSLKGVYPCSFLCVIKKIITFIKNVFKKPKRDASAVKKTNYEKPVWKEGQKSFSHYESCRQESPLGQQELSRGYGEDVIILQVRDPWCIYSYWHIVERTRDNLKRSLGEEKYSQAQWALRVYDVSYINFNGYNAHYYFDIALEALEDNWYIHVSSGRSFCVDLGLKLSSGEFITVVRSNIVMTPLDGPSWIMDEEWMILDEDFMKLYSFEPNIGATSPVMKKGRISRLILFVSSNFTRKLP